MKQPRERQSGHSRGPAAARADQREAFLAVRPPTPALPTGTVSIDPMPTDAALASQTQLVLLAAFALAFVFGLVAQRIQFCTMGAVADIVSFGDWSRMRQWLLAIGVAVLGTQAAALAGWIDTAQSIYTTPRFGWLGYIVGGGLFGFGMVLAGGCGSRTLVRAGGGSLKALVVLLVLGLSAYISLRGLLAVVRVSTIEQAAVDLGRTQDLPTLLAPVLGASPVVLQAIFALLIGGGCVVFALARADFRTRENLPAALLGAVIAGVWVVSGHLGFVAEHPNTLEPAFLGTASGRMESLTFVAPVAATLDWLMLFSDRSKVLTLGVVSVGGVLAGATTQAIARGQFRWQGFAGTEDTANHLAGAALMGFGGVTAVGCTIGQGLSGVSTLAAGSFVALAAIIGGAVLGLRYQMWRIERQ